MFTKMLNNVLNCPRYILKNSFIALFLALFVTVCQAESPLSYDIKNEKDGLLNENSEKTIKLLAFQGGGVRALMGLSFLEELENYAAKPVCELFDTVIGTSAGAIAAASLTHTTDSIDCYKRYPTYTANEAAQLFEENASNIFKPQWLSLGGLLGPKYDINSLKNTCRRFFGNTTFQQSLIPTMITAYDIGLQRPTIFTSWKGEYKNVDTVEIVASSATAPSYFAPNTLSVFDQNKNLQQRHFIDGGIFANNPVLPLISEAKILYPGAKKYQVVYLGTGLYESKSLYPEFKSASLLTWAAQLPYLIIDSQEQLARSLILQDHKVDYSEWNPYISVESKKIDNYNPENLAYLKNAMANLIDDQYDQFESLARELLEEQTLGY